MNNTETTTAFKPAGRDKKKVLLGLALIVLAFVGVIAIFYVVLQAYQTKEKRVAELNEQLELVSSQKELVEEKVAQLQEELKAFPDLEKIVAQAKEVYGEQETERKDGHLWVDRQGKNFVVTLGALNGLMENSRLIIFDDNQTIGYLRVASLMDVISYVEPEDMTMSDFGSDYYSVRIAE